MWPRCYTFVILVLALDRTENLLTLLTRWMAGWSCTLSVSPFIRLHFDEVYHRSLPREVPCGMKARSDELAQLIFEAVSEADTA